MNEAEAIAELRLWVEPYRDPKLTDTELEQILARNRPEDGVYDDEAMLRAKADAWDLKTNKASDYFDTSVNGRNGAFNQIKRNCEERARFYRRRLPVHIA